MRIASYGLILIGLMLTFNSFAQSVKGVKAEFDSRTGVIKIYYDLMGRYTNADERYTVRAYYSVDSGKVYNQITEVTGESDIGDGIETGTGKIIAWDYFLENPEFDGQNVMFRVEAKWSREFEIRRLESLGKSRSALNAMLLPGWGHAKVTGKKGFWWKTALIYGVTATGLYFTISANNKYDKYQNTSNIDEALRLYDQSNSQRQLGFALLGAGGAMWLSNIIWVAIKGGKNQKTLNQLKSNFQAHSPFQLNIDPNSGAAGLKFNFRF